MKKTSVLTVLTAAAFIATPLYAQDTSSQPSSQASSEPSSAASSEPSGQPSSEPSSQPSSQSSSQPSSQPSSAASSEPSSDGGGGSDDGGVELGFSLDLDVSFRFTFTLPQAIEFRDIIIDADVTPTELDTGADISVGATVPSTITLTPLPLRIVQLYPELEGYLFFLLSDGRIVVVHPQTLKIVLILIID